MPAPSTTRTDTAAKAPAPRPPAARDRHADHGGGAGSAPPSAGVRWAAFSCLAGPVTLTAYGTCGTSFGNAATAAAGLAAVAAGCRLLLHRNESAGRSPVSPLNRRPPLVRIPATRRTGAHTGSQGGSRVHEGSRTEVRRVPGA